MKDTTKTILTISTGFLILFWITKQECLLAIAIFVSLAGIFSPYLSQIIALLWTKLGELLALIVPNIILSIVFFGILFPIARLSRIFGKKDTLHLANASDSLFISKEKKN